MNSDCFSHNIEDNYLKDATFPLINDSFVIISGCSGGGKSSILTELGNRGFTIVIEPGRQIVKEQSAIDGDALPWVNINKFSELALSRNLVNFNSQECKEPFIFFDRSLIDTLKMDQSQPTYFENAAKKFRYNCLVFLVPPWKEIFMSDPERKHNFEAAKKEFDELVIKYKEFGYETVLVPQVSVKERVEFILNKLDALKRSSTQPISFIDNAKQLLEWNREKLTQQSNLHIEDLNELFAKEFVVIANEREYNANHQTYFDFLNKFRSNIQTIDYEVQEYINDRSTVVMPLKASVKRTDGKIDVFDAILILKFNESEKIIHWQEVYSIDQSHF